MIIFNYTYKKCGKHPKKVRPQLHICGYGGLIPEITDEPQSKRKGERNVTERA